MSVDIIQIITHVIAFLIMLWVLRKFAWKPFLGILEERRLQIQSDFDTAAAKRREAEETAARYTAQMKDIENEKRARIQEGIGEGRKIADEIREEARGEAKKIIDKAREDIQRDVAKAQVELKEKIVAMTMTATERVIRQTLDQEGHRRLVTNFIDELEKANPGRNN
jgi:F-type H+-transporting ATPase subunit b